MESRKIYKCFISSPSDCQQEREICQKVIDNINGGLAKHLKINFETFMWEYDVLPDMGRNGQEIIDEHIEKSNYDIFIGIMKNRFGQPTIKAGSGTEHEYNDALQRKKTSGNSLPRVLIFFGKENVDPEKFDVVQYEKVKKFKEKASSEGLYTVFLDIGEFEKKLKEKLELFIADYSPLDQPVKTIKEVDVVLKKMENDLSKSLKTYNEQSPVWIDPIISSKKDVPIDPTKNNDFRVEIHSLINAPENIAIKAPSEFGLTSLAHYLKLEAWKVGKVFVYVDTRSTKKHKIVKDIFKEVEDYFYKKQKDIDCILLDSVIFEENGMMQMIKNVCDDFKDVPIIIFNTIENNFFLKSEEDDKVEIKRDFKSYYLLPLPQNDVRKIVNSYSRIRSFVEDKAIILSKVTKDLEILNMHRTAKNCISILRAFSRIGSENGPVNRTKLLETILNTIFEEYDIPTYRDKKPDVKDCSFVLGYFCELLVLRSDFEFTSEYFKDELSRFCEKNYITLNLGYLLNVLEDNSILGKKSTGHFYFKNAYWVYYFIAQRMNMNKEFLENIYKNKKYIDYPEIIEFYTGIDRNKEDALRILVKDVQDTLTTVRNKVDISDDLNPFKSISWNPDISSLEKEEAKISENVISSGLPDEVKDKYDDKKYNQIRPYNQVINSVIRDYSFLVLWRQISATSRALRNSDFVDPNLKKEVLDTIVQSWNEINKLLIALAPLLADRGRVSFEGKSFTLSEDFDDITDPDKKRQAVLLSLPINVVGFFKDDIFSAKMAPLLVDRAEKEPNSLIKHEFMLLLIEERPAGWNKTIDNYIIDLDKNSFFLADVLSVLTLNSEYKVNESNDKRLLEMLASKCRAKHIFNHKNPDMGLINRLKKIEGDSKY